MLSGEHRNVCLQPDPGFGFGPDCGYAGADGQGQRDPPHRQLRCAGLVGHVHRLPDDQFVPLVVGKPEVTFAEVDVLVHGPGPQDGGSQEQNRISHITSFGHDRPGLLQASLPA